MSLISVPVSPGELLDKITILEIKSERMHDPDKLANVRHELHLLEDTWAEVEGGAALPDQRARLKAVNEALWEIEDHIRIKERDADFGPDFIELARSVYFRNDERAAVKREVNQRLGSRLVEEKSYQDYRR
ncbi:MAG TPA: DUF6165 family protein [Rhodanobacteraceae bacterium]|nr:DUF6165 family protein [Rhodanobacteraceae bacterium]